MIDCVIYDKKAVKEKVGGVDVHRRVLLVVEIEIQGQCFRYFPCDNGGVDTIVSFCESFQHRVVHVIVNEDDPFACRSYQVRHESVSVKDLPIVEDTLGRRQCGANEETNLLFGFADPLFQSFNPLIYSISAQKIFLEDGVCPLTESCSANAFDAIPD